MPPLPPPPPAQVNPLLRWGALFFLLAGYVCVGLAFALVPYWDCVEDSLGRHEWLDMLMVGLLLAIPLLLLHALVFSLIAIGKGQASRLNVAVLVVVLLSVVALMLL